MAEQEKLARQIFQRPVDEVWQEIEKYFQERNPIMLEKALNNPKQKMALLYRWYLGLSSRWAITSQKGREMDYQVWCGPSIGSFNDWTRNTYLEKPENRSVVDVALHILTGAAYQYRLHILSTQGVQIPAAKYTPSAPLVGR